jgi:hypothetical protein
MLERRNSDRVSLNDIWVREENGDYLFSYSVKNISEDGLFLDKRVLSPDQEPFSKFSFSLPNGTILRGIVGKVVREEKSNSLRGVAVHLQNLTEEARIALKKFVSERTIHGHA